MTTREKSFFGNLLERLLGRLNPEPPQVKTLAVVSVNSGTKLIDTATLTRYSNQNFELEYPGGKISFDSELEAIHHLHQVYQTRYNGKHRIEIKGHKYRMQNT